MRAEDAEMLISVQQRSYEHAGQGLRDSYPPDRAMDTHRLTEFLTRVHYAVLATSRPDGRPHAAPIAFTVWQGAFWIASVRGARVRNLRTTPYATIVIMEGEGNTHRAVVAEGHVTLHALAALNEMPEEFRQLVRARVGDVVSWAAALIEMRPERIFSYDATKSM